MDLRGARAVVTGGSSGIGLATAQVLAARGCTVVVTGSDASRVRAAEAAVQAAAAAARTAGPASVTDPRNRAVVCDLSDAAAVADLAASLAAGPGIDLLVHSAGIGLRGPAEALGADDLDRLLAVNVRAAVALSAAVLPAMRARRRGRVAFVGSIAGAVGAAGEAAYSASKAAVAGYADALRAEFAGTGVGVTLLVPGVVRTAFFERRGVPYHRSRPRPVSAQRVATALVRGIERNRDVVTVPGWLRVPIAVHGLAPQAFARLSGRFGR